MKQSNFECLTSIDLKVISCRCGAPDPEASEDAELAQLFHELALTLFSHMEPGDADILARSELRGQTPSDIAAQIGCSRAEVKLRINHAQRCFCRLVVLALAQLNSG